MMMCHKCSKMMAWVTLLLGIVFILNSMGVYFNFSVSEWGIVLTVFGLCALFGLECTECQRVMGKRRR